MATGRFSTILTLARGNVRLACSNPSWTNAHSAKTELERQTAALYFVRRELTGAKLTLQDEWELYLQALRSVVEISFPELKPLHVTWVSGTSIEWILRDPTIYQPASITPHPPQTESRSFARPWPTSPSNEGT